MTAQGKIGVHEEFLAVPDTKIAQVVAGELHVHPRPRASHAMVSSGLGGELVGPFQRGRGGGPGGWILLDEPELHLGGDILVPDLAGWRRTRMPELPDVAFFELAPDWICEVLSPSTAKLDRGKKLSAYGREGVPSSGSSTPTRTPWRSSPAATTAATRSPPSTATTTSSTPSPSRSSPSS